VQLRGTFSTKNNAMNTHFLHDRKKLISERSRHDYGTCAVFSIFPYLSMVLKLLQMDIDKTTGEVSPSVNGPAKGRKNYKLFEGTRIITDNNS
jgi:hypothetical protein